MEFGCGEGGIEKMVGSGKTVVVTGAAGFIASWIVKLLLQRGYTVRGTVRDPDDASKVGHLREMAGAKERLTLVKANLLEDGAFDAVVDGADGVFHTASPVSVPNATHLEQYLEPALKGTLNVLQACEKATSVKRVVLTSSLVAVHCEKSSPLTASSVLDETSWADADVCTKNGHFYHVSKTLAEKAAWDFVKGKRFSLVVINPVMALGTLLQPTLNFSCELVMNYVSGVAKKYLNTTFAYVDVQDVALGHILGYEVPDAEGRYLLVDRVVHGKELAAILHKQYPGYPVPTEPAYDPSQEAAVYKMNNEKAQKLGIKFKPVESQLKDLVRSLQLKGFIGKEGSTNET